jgi:histidine triad (HIT) family protein
MSDCIFCKIVERTSPARIVHEDERTLAFMDLFPLTRGHALVVPKVHATNLFEIAPDDAAAVMLTTQRVAKAAMAAFGAAGLNLFQTNGAVAMQTVFHLHVHVLPRYVGDGFKVVFTREMGSEEELEDAAALLRAAL